MWQTNNRRLLLYLTLLFYLSSFGQLNASEMGYLDAIKADYNEFLSGSFDPPPDSPWISSTSNSADNNIPSYEKLQDFSAFLKKESPGSFIFFNNLSERYQRRLHQEYLKTGNLEEIKQNIFRYSREVKKQNKK